MKKTKEIKMNEMRKKKSRLCKRPVLFGVEKASSDPWIICGQIINNRKLCSFCQS